MNDLYGLQLMQGLLDGPYLPFTNSSLRPFRLAHVLNDMIVNSRKTILEFGSGISTIMMGRLIKRNDTGARVVSVEHDPDWAGVVRTSIRKEGLDGFISIVHAPLGPCPFAVESNLWYEPEILAAAFTDSLFDLVVVDGPPAYEVSKEMSRYPALPFIQDKLSARCSVFLDDADRVGEKAIIRRWEEEYAVRFRILGDCLAYASRGESFNVNVI